MAEVASLGLKVDGVGNINTATSSLNKLSGAAGGAERSAGGAANGIKSAGDASARSSRDLTKLAGAAKAAVGALAALGVIRGISNLSRTFGQFESSMARVSAVSRATESQFARLTDTARALGATTEFTATQAASGLEFLARAGWSANESISALPAVLNLATAASMDLGASADVTSNIMSAFGIAATDAASVADVLAAASSRANTDVQQLGSAMSYVGPVAAALKIPMGDAAAAVGALSDAGIQGSAAGTGLRRVLSSLANPTGAAAAALRSLGVELESVNPATNSLVDIVDRLSRSGMSAAEALTIFGDRGGPAILALVENNDKVRELSGELRNVEGEAGRMASTMRDTLSGDAKTLASAFESLSISIGANFVESARSGVQGITNLIRRADEFAQNSLPSVIASIQDFGRQIGMIMDDVTNAVGTVAVVIRELIPDAAIYAGGEVVRFLRGAFGELPSNVRAIVQIMGVEFGFLVDYVKAVAIGVVDIFSGLFSALADSAKAAGRVIATNLNPFNDETLSFSDEIGAAFSGPMIEANNKVAASFDVIKNARRDSIAFILEERDAAVSSAADQVDSGKLVEEQIKKIKKAVGDTPTPMGGVTGGETGKELEKIASALNAIQRAADPAFAALQDYQSAMDTLADSLINNLIDDQQFVTLADHLLQVRDAALEAAQGMSWLDNMENGMDALQDGFQKIHATMDYGSKEAQKLGQAMQALSVVQGIAAILNQGMGDPYTAIGRMAAMAAAVASLIGSVGFAGSGNTTAADAQASQGTGSVLGDSAAKSESILKSSEITADATSSLVSINRGMLTALQALQRGIGSAAGMVVRNDAGFSGATEGYGAIPEHDPVGALTGVRLDFVGDFVKDLLGGSSKVVNEGIAIASGRISELIDGTLVSAFQDVENKKSFLHSKKTKRQAEALGEAASAQFSLIFSSMADVVTEAGIALGVSGSELEKKIAALQVDAFEISLKDLSGEEQQAEIEAVFSSIFDGLAGAVAPYAAEFQQVGEGMAETLVRVATQVQVTQEAVKMLGINIGDGLSQAELARASDELVTLGGGLENFIDSMKSFVSAFASEQQKLTTATDGVASVFDSVGISAGVPQTAQELTALMSTLTDPKQINGLLSLTDSFKELFAAQDKTFALNQQLLRAQGENEAALVREREHELLALTDSQRALQLRIWALNDEASAAEEAAQAQQALADLQRSIGDQLLDIISPAHAELERLNRAMGDQIAQAEALGIAENDLVNMRHLHQLQLMKFAAGLEESIASLNTDLFGSTENAMDRTVNAVDSGMNRIRESMIRAIDGVNKWLDSSMLSSVSPLTPEDRLGEAERQFNLQFAGAMGGDTDAMAALPKLADQLLSEASGFFGGSTQEFDQIWMQVRDAMEQVSGLSIPDAQDPQRAIQTATESTAMSALQQITLASDMIGQIAALSRVTGETPADIAERLGVPIGGLLDILESTPGEFAGAIDQNFNDLVTGFDMTIDPLLSVQNAQLEETRQMRTEQNERLDRIEQALLDGVNYQRATAVNTGETANQQGQAVAIQRRNENKPSGAGRINV